MIPLKFLYTFEEAEHKWSYEVQVDPVTLNALPVEGTEAPEWTKLDFQKCEHCPLDPSTHPHCPVAKNIFNLVDKTKANMSCSKVTVTVKAKERSYIKSTDLQEALHSLMGLIMATSDCPYTTMFKPMARFHLPFASPEDTFFRIISTFLIHGYYKNQSTEESINHLKTYYKDIEKLNKGMLARIHSVVKGDADKNAIVALNIFAQLFHFEAKSNFESIKKIFVR